MNVGADCPKIAHEECDAPCLLAEGHEGDCAPAHDSHCPQRPNYTNAYKTLVAFMLLGMMKNEDWSK